MSLKITDAAGDATEPAALDRPALLRHEARLGELLKQFLVFKTCSVYFPQAPCEEVEILRAERTLMAPLRLGGVYLGCVRLTGIRLPQARRLAPFLTAILSLCLDNIWLAESRSCDPETGLLFESAFLERLAARLDGISADGKPVAASTSLGVIALIWPHSQLAGRRLEPDVFAALRSSLACVLREHLPVDSIAGRLGWIDGRHEIGVFLPASGRVMVHNQARRLLCALRDVLREKQLERLGLDSILLAGHVLYPQDLRGGELRLDPLGRARILRDRARLSAEMAWEAGHLSLPVLGFAWIASQAGKIIELLDSSLVRVNLGSEANVRKGDRFHIIHCGGERALAGSKGQLVIRSIGARDAEASLMYTNQPGRMPAVGDMLLPAWDAWHMQEDNASIMSQERFLAKFALDRKGCQNYCLIITRFSYAAETNPAEAVPSDLHRDLRRFLCSGLLPQHGIGLAGWYGGAGAIFFMPGMKENEGREFCLGLHDCAATAGFSAVSGLFAYPCLNFRRSQSEECALKSLAYAALLPKPHIGTLDHLALAISADGRFSEGDEMGAMEEYRLALLMKPDDPAILNSLGVCMGALNRNGDAVDLFTRAARNCSEASLGAKIFYNLGAVHEKENELAKARACFRKCIRLLPDHVYAWMRLGRIYAHTGRLAVARALYNRALRLTREAPQLRNIVQRHLARLEKDRSQTEKAREMLHDALLRDPEDGEALLLLAQTYLEDDPSMAEYLARRCLRLGMDAWPTLADALDAMGKPEEAAMARAGRSRA